jgi:photosystem II stability/assembly factor-like uncharacterized protein
VHNVGHGWSFIDLPQAPGFAGAAGQGSIPGRFTDFTTVAGEPNTLVVSDGGEIWRSGDAGCSWQPVYTVASDLPASWEMAPYVVTKFAAAAPGPHGGDRVYALLIPGFTVEFAMALGVAAPALVLLSPDGGKTWKLQQPASASWPSQPRCNAVIDVSVSPADQQVIDLLCVGGGAEQLANSQLHGTPYQAYRSTDGGLSWAQVTYPSLFGGAQFTADPYSRNVAWTVGEVGRYLTVYRSGDGGATWQSHQMSKPDGDADWELSVAPTSGGRTAVVAASLPVAIYDSTDGSGMRWHLDGVDQHVKPLQVTGSFLPDGRDLLVTNLDFGCGRTLVLHRTTLRGRSVFVPLPSQAGQTWGSWHYTGGVHPSIVGRTQPCDGSAPPALLRYQP